MLQCCGAGAARSRSRYTEVSAPGTHKAYDGAGAGSGAETLNVGAGAGAGAETNSFGSATLVC
jgi:hypothetical protein